MPTSRRPPRSLLIAGVVMLVLVVAFSVPWKLNFLRGEIAERVQAATGRRFAVEGDLWWRWWPRRLTAEDVTFGNPEWAGREAMFKARSVDATIRLLPLLTDRRLVVPRVHVVRPDLWLETTEDGRFNARLDRQQKDTGSGVALGEVRLDEGILHFVQRHRRTDVQVRFDNRLQDGAPRLTATASGRWNGLEVKAKGSGDGVLRLRDTSRPYALDASASIGGTDVQATGSVTGLARPTAADLRIRAQGPSLGQWYRIVGVGLPETPPYATQGRVRLVDGVWHYEDFTAEVGRSDLSGRVRYETRGKRPLVAGNLVSRRLDLGDLAPLVGEEPGAARRGSARPSDNGKLLPHREFSTEKWNTLDADVRFEGKSVRNVGRFQFDNLSMHVVLDDRRITVDPLRFGLAGGELRGRAVIDGRQQPIAARLEADGRRLKLDRLLPVMDNQRLALGSVNAKIELAGRGNAIGDMLGTADGEAQMAMGRGRVSNLLLELLGLDGQEALGFLIRGDEPVPVRCALVDLGLKDGVVQLRNVVFDTEDTIIEATGRANLARETLDLRVRPVAKDVSFLSLRVPFDIEGTFTEPDITPDRGQLALRAGGALLLGTVAPLAALIPLIETGPGEDADCQSLVKRARSEGVPVRNEGRRGESTRGDARQGAGEGAAARQGGGNGAAARQGAGDQTQAR